MTIGAIEWLCLGIILGYLVSYVQIGIRNRINRKTAEMVGSLTDVERKDQERLRSFGGYAPPRSVLPPDLPEPRLTRPRDTSKNP